MTAGRSVRRRSLCLIGQASIITRVNSELILQLAHDCGFELAGVAPAIPLEESSYYHEWVTAGYAGEMRYLTDRRAELRNDPRHLLPSAKSVICAGKLYNGPEPYSTRLNSAELGWISRYAWGEDYHDVLRRGLANLAEKLRAHIAEPFEWKICVDTAPLLERAAPASGGSEKIPA
jgi:epoxyqueuosine reductase